MKRIYTLFAFAAITAAFASCNKNEYAATSGRTLSINVGTETKTVLRNGEKVNWVDADKICIFDTENAGFIFKTAQSDVPSATFTCENWTGTTPVFAVHSNASNITKNIYDGSIVTSYLNPTQSIANKNSYAKEASLSVGKVSENGGSYSVEAMKNCFAIIGFTLKDSTITSVTLSGNNGENLAGWVDVNYDNLDSTEQPFWTVNTTKGGAQTITVKPTGSACKVKGNGAFEDKKKYYIAVLPQTLSKGMTLVLARADGMSATREITSSVELKRSHIKEFEAPLDDGLIFKKGDIVLDFTSITAYTFKYDVEGVATNLPDRKKDGIYIPAGTDFWAAAYPDYKFNGAVRYWNTSNGCLNFAKDTYIRFPHIPEYKLSKITEFKVLHSAGRNYKITSAPKDTYAAGVAVAGGEEQELSKDSELTSFILTDEYDADKDYYIVCDNEAGIRFKLTYEYVPQE